MPQTSWRIDGLDHCRKGIFHIRVFRPGDEPLVDEEYEEFARELCDRGAPGTIYYAANRCLLVPLPYSLGEWLGDKLGELVYELQDPNSGLRRRSLPPNVVYLDRFRRERRSS